ncbi:MAG: prohibitin family protein [Candidatus Obscuribacterales bacterium]
MESILFLLTIASIVVFAATKNQMAKLGGILGFILFGGIFVCTSFAIVIPPGYAGVVFNRMEGVQKTVLPTGFHLIIPFLQTVYTHDIRTQNMTFTGEEAVSADQQVIHTDITVNFHPVPEFLGALYQSVGFDYDTKVVTPVVREALKAEIAKQPVDKLLANREEVSAAIRAYVEKKLAERHIEMELISLTNLRFSQEYQNAVEMKQVALQQAEAKRNELQKAKVEADITRTAADAEAYKILATNKALGSSPEYVRLEAIRKLNPNAEVIYVPHGSNILIPGGNLPSSGNK